MQDCVLSASQVKRGALSFRTPSHGGYNVASVQSLNPPRRAHKCKPPMPFQLCGSVSACLGAALVGLTLFWKSLLAIGQCFTWFLYTEPNSSPAGHGKHDQNRCGAFVWRARSTCCLLLGAAGAAGWRERSALYAFADAWSPLGSFPCGCDSWVRDPSVLALTETNRCCARPLQSTQTLRKCTRQ
jgi:hypothetical protein